MHYCCQWFLSINDGRFCKATINLDEPVHCAWDHGYNDATAIVFFQYVNNSLTIHDSYVAHKKLIPEHCNAVREWLVKNKAVMGTQFLPHDGNNTNDVTGQTRSQTIEKNGLITQVMPRLQSKKDIIDFMRSNFNRLTISKSAFSVKQKLYSAEKDKSKMHLTWKHDDLLDAISYVFRAVQLGYCDEIPAARITSNTPKRKAWLSR